MVTKIAPRRSGGYRSLAERLRLRAEAIRLQSLGLSYLQISRKIGVQDSQIRGWLAGVIPDVERYEPNLAPRGELAYLIGFYLGDGSRARGQKNVRFKLVDSEQTHFLNRLVARVLSTKPRRIRTSRTPEFIRRNHEGSTEYEASPGGRNFPGSTFLRSL